MRNRILIILFVVTVARAFSFYDPSPVLRETPHFAFSVATVYSEYNGYYDSDFAFSNYYMTNGTFLFTDSTFYHAQFSIVPSFSWIAPIGLRVTLTLPFDFFYEEYERSASLTTYTNIRLGIETIEVAARYTLFDAFVSLGIDMKVCIPVPLALSIRTYNKERFRDDFVYYGGLMFAIIPQTFPFRFYATFYGQASDEHYDKYLLHATVELVTSKLASFYAGFSQQSTYTLERVPGCYESTWIGFRFTFSERTTLATSFRKVFTGVSDFGGTSGIVVNAEREFSLELTYDL